MASLLKQPGTVLIISGVIVTAIGLYATLRGQSIPLIVMGNTVPTSEWGPPLAVVGIILLLIGAAISYYYGRKK